MKYVLALLLFTAPLAAQTPTDQKLVFNVVVTLVRTGGPILSPSPAPVPSPVGDPSPAPTPTPTPTPVPPPAPPPATPPPPSGGAGCSNHYGDAVNSMNEVVTALQQVQALYNSALSSNQISSDAFSAGTNSVSTVMLDNGDVRDMVRIAGPSGVIVQNLSFVTQEVGTFSGLLGVTPQLKQSLAPLVTSMQNSLGAASTWVTSSTCPQSVP